MRGRTSLSRLFTGLLVAVAIAAGGGCGSHDGSPQARESAQLHDLGGIDKLRDVFNDNAGVPRLLLILSPG